MLSIANETIALTAPDDGLRIRIEDRKRGAAWEIDPAGGGFDEKPPAGRWTHSPLTAYQTGSVRRLGEGAIEVVYSVPGGRAVYIWELLADGIEVRLRMETDKVLRAALPGSVRPAQGTLEILVPINQGALLRSVCVTHDHRNPIGGGAMLGMLGYLGERAALLAVQ
jgi:hypothetical protein